MSANVLLQTRIDAGVKERAAEVLDYLGLTLSDVVRIRLTRIVNEGVLPFGFTADPVAHDAWFRATVLAALNDARSAVPHAEVEAHFAKRRETALRKVNYSAGEASDSVLTGKAGAFSLR